VVGKDVVDGGGRNKGVLAAKILKAEGKEKEMTASSIEFLDEAVSLFFLEYQPGRVDYHSVVNKFVHWMRVLFVLRFWCWSCHQSNGGPPLRFSEWREEWSGEKF
jgi:hypothetical protein